MLGDVTVCLKKALFCNSLLRNYAITFLFKMSIFLRRAWTQIKSDYNSENLSPEVIKLFLCSTQLSREFTTWDSLYKIIFERPCILLQLKKSLALSLSNLTFQI